MWFYYCWYWDTWQLSKYWNLFQICLNCVSSWDQNYKLSPFSEEYENFVCYMGFLCTFADRQGFLAFLKLVINLKFLFTRLLLFDHFCDSNKLIAEIAVMYQLTTGILPENFIRWFHCYAKHHRVYLHNSRCYPVACYPPRLYGIPPSYVRFIVQNIVWYMTLKLLCWQHPAKQKNGFRMSVFQYSFV